MRNIYDLVFRSLKQHPARTLLSAAAVATGTGMIIATDGVTSAILGTGDPILARSGDFGAGALGTLLGISMAVVGVVILLAAGLLVFNTFGMSITERRHQLGLLRVIGMKRRQIFRTVIVEALITGGSGTLLGVIGGPLLARVLLALVVDAAEISASDGNPSTGIVLLAAAMGIGVSLIAALIPARRATRVSPLEALHDGKKANEIAPASKRPAALGAVMIGILGLYLIAAPPGEWALPPLSLAIMAILAGWWLAGFGLMLYAAIGGAAKWARPILQRLLGTTGRLMADNLRRDRQRVALTVLTLIASLTMIVSVNGTLQHIGVSITQADENLLRTWVFLSFDINGGMETYRKLTITSLQIPPERLTEIETIAGESALVSGAYAVIVPELSFLIPNLPSFIVDEHALRRAGIVNFYEGGWETAMPPMESGCGLLLTPLVAQNNDVWTGDTLTINSGVEGPIECTVAGIGTSPVFNTSVLSSRMARAYGVIAPAAIIIQPDIDADADALIAALSAFAGEHENLYLINVADFFTQIREGAGEFTALLNGPLLLTILVAMAGVTNTMMMSVTERQHELGLLRAVGATRRQIRVIVAGEAALMGLIGAALGVIVGAGLVAIVAVSGGSAFWNVPANLWGTAIDSLRPALGAGLLGLIAAPVLCAGAAWLPARGPLHQPPIQMMERQR